MSRVAQLDKRLIDWTQDAYLWLFDRTGLYLGTCCLVIYVLGEMSFLRGVLGFVIMFLVSVAFLRLYALQMAGMKDTINSEAREWRSSIFRRVFIVTQILLAGVPPWSVSYTLSMVAGTMVFGYLAAAQVRDREPKELLPRRVTMTPSSMTAS